jgi:rhodanese-related sulfurtransferase
LDDDLFFIYRSGGRSLAAAKAIVEAGYRASSLRPAGIGFGRRSDYLLLIVNAVLRGRLLSGWRVPG